MKHFFHSRYGFLHLFLFQNNFKVYVTYFFRQKLQYFKILNKCENKWISKIQLYIWQGDKSYIISYHNLQINISPILTPHKLLWTISWILYYNGFVSLLRWHRTLLFCNVCPSGNINLEVLLFSFPFWEYHICMTFEE